MPELPEVETTRAALAPSCLGQTITALELRTDALRAPLAPDLSRRFVGRTITALERRGKHLLLHSDDPQLSLHLHLGMSGSLRICAPGDLLGPYDFVLLSLGNGRQIRLRDPRKFGHCGAIDPTNPPPALKNLGPEPLGDEFTGDFLFRQTRKRTAPIKNHLMNQEHVVGIGNIYAAEALFLSGILPTRPAGSLDAGDCERLVAEIKALLKRAIAAGGTTLKDFHSPDGRDGHFIFALDVYGKAGQPCPRCGTRLENVVLGGRASVFCPRCQH